MKADRPHDLPPPSLEDRIYLNRVKILFGHAAGNMLNILIGALLIFAVLSSGGTSEQILSIWFMLLLIPMIAVTTFERHVRRTGLDTDNAYRFMRIRIAIGSLVGLMYGVSVFLLPGSQTVHHDTFLLVIMSTLVTIAALGYSVMPPYYLILALLTMMPMTVHFLYTFLQDGERYYLILFVMALLWQIVVLKKALRVSATAIEAIRLNEQLHDEIEEHMQTKEALRHLALHDALTDLANRRHFEETAERTLHRSRREGSRFGIVAIDLNDFKPINDTYGHEAGDLVLKSVADRLRNIIRASDFVARVGGDEFCMIIENVSSEADMTEVVNKIESAMEPPLSLSTASVPIGASIGWAIFPLDGDQIDTLHSVADKRMYTEKKERRIAS